MAGSKGQRSGGRNRKAPGLHVLQATFRKDRHGQAPVSDHVPGGLPEPPVGLPEAVLEQWRIVVNFLQAMGTVSRVDALIVEQYARLFVETAHIAVTQTKTATSIARLEEILQNERARTDLDVDTHTQSSPDWTATRSCSAFGRSRSFDNSKRAIRPRFGKGEWRSGNT